MAAHLANHETQAGLTELGGCLAALSRQGRYATEEALVELYVEDWLAMCGHHGWGPADDGEPRQGVEALRALLNAS
jgi:hypothetical protein